MTSRMPAITFLGTAALAFVASSGREETACAARIVAVDGERTVWIDQGCETPVDLDEGRTISAAQMDDLWTKFAALPFDQSAGDCSQPDALLRASRAARTFDGGRGVRRWDVRRFFDSAGGVPAAGRGHARARVTDRLR